MTIISVSRRTDVPAFHMEWLMERVREGKAYSQNPFNGVVKEVSLAREDVSAMVFWSKDYRPAMDRLSILRDMGYELFFHYTITGHGPVYEPHVPPWQEAAANFLALAARFPGRAWWRFDPILISPKSGWEEVEKRFRGLAEALAGHTDRCFVSFAQVYPKVARRMGGMDVEWLPEAPTVEERRRFAGRLGRVGKKYGIQLYACCSSELTGPEVLPAKCIDAGWMGFVLGRELSAPHSPSRKGCGCDASVDIGRYDTCVHGCVYCYANRNHAAAEKNRLRHHPESSMI